MIPEYNFGFNAATKNAVDYLHGEWQHKPAGIVSYGGISAGTRATQMLKQVLTALKIMPVPEAVNIPFVGQLLDEDKRFKSSELIDASATAMLDEVLAGRAPSPPSARRTGNYRSRKRLAPVNPTCSP